MLLIACFVIVGILQCGVHGYNIPGSEDDSIHPRFLHKRDISDQRQASEDMQRDSSAPMPMLAAEEGGEDVDARTNQQGAGGNLHSSSSSRHSSYQSSRSQSYSGSSNGGSSSHQTPGSSRQYSYDAPRSQDSTQRSGQNPGSRRQYGYDTSRSQSSSQGTRQNPGTSRQYTYSSQTYQGSSQGGGSQPNPRVAHRQPAGNQGYQVYRSEGGATATYIPSGSRTRVNTQQSTSQQGPTGRRIPTAVSYPLGPILSTGGGVPLQQPANQPVYQGGHFYQARSQTDQGQSRPQTGQGQRTYQTVYRSQGQTYGGQGQTYGGQGQPYAGQYQPRQYPQQGSTFTGRGQRPTYGTQNRQYTYTSGGQPVYTGFGAPQPYPQGGGTQGNRYGSCPETGIRMRINGMECANAIDTYGSFLCYRHEYTSRECCEKCQPLKNPTNAGCEYGDHVFQCRQIQPHDCYDLRNRQSCCQTCETLKDSTDEGCEWGDMIQRCNRVSQDPSLCYIPENQRLCCRTCSQMRRGAVNQECPWGDQNSNLCRPFDQYGGVRINCYAEPIRRMCCQTCARLRSRMPQNMLGCEYGDRPVIFNTQEFGSLNCTSFFRHFPADQCQVNQAVSINCCYTCHRYGGGGQRTDPVGRDRTREQARREQARREQARREQARREQARRDQAMRGQVRRDQVRRDHAGTHQ